MNINQPYTQKSKKITQVRQGVIMAEDSIDDVDLSSFKKQYELNPALWDNNILKSQVRLKLLDIADDFFDTLKLDWVEVYDITLTGSLANYTWSKYSDIDLHILIDFNRVDENVELVRNYVDDKKSIWNNEHDSLNIYGYAVEVYVQDINESHDSTGVYSLEKNEWIEKPNVDKIPNLNLDKYIVKDKVSKFINIIDSIEEEFNKDRYLIGDDSSFINKINLLIRKLRGIRKHGLDTDGEMSVGNIIYKTLRRFGYIDKLYDMKSYSYDAIKSIK